MRITEQETRIPFEGDWKLLARRSVLERRQLADRRTIQTDFGERQGDDRRKQQRRSGDDRRMGPRGE